MNRFNLFVFAALSSMFLLGCSDPEEFAPKALGPFTAIQSNGGVKFKLVSSATNQVLSTSLPESMYNVSNGVLNINAAGGGVTVAIRNLKMLTCNTCSVENPSPLVADTLVMYIHAGASIFKTFRSTTILVLVPSIPAGINFRARRRSST